MTWPLDKIGDIYMKHKYKSGIINNNFSIICSNCIGGVISHYAGQQFRSPTVNLWIRQDEFIRMCCNLKYYMSLDLKFVETKYPYPIGKCGDITIHFNHDHSENEAAEKWNRRKKRINYDNLYIIMYNGDGIEKKDLLKLNSIPCKNKIVFSPIQTNYDLSFMFYFKPYGTDSLALRGMDKDIWGIQRILRFYDFTKFLNV